MIQPLRMNAMTVLALGAALLLAGCGSKGDDPGVATAGATPTSTATADANVIATYIDGVRAFVSCMRAARFDVTDPDEKGQIEFKGDLRLLKQDPAFVAASGKCSPLLPPVPAELERANRPKMTDEEIDRARRYADCMRANGAPDFPDPDADGYYPSESDARSPVWDQTTEGARRGERICGPIVGAPATPGPGQG